ncbi:hypothetical protein CKQ90_33360, partial [Klebsiella pneumoniae]
RGKPTDFWSLSLPHETKIYVPKMLALSDILKNSKRYGVKLPTADESRALARVRGKPTDFWSLSLPHETKIYVPKMLALSDILKNS